MSVIVDPNAPDTWSDKLRRNKNFIIGYSISTAYTAALAYCIWGDAPVWLANLTNTLGWVLTFLVFIVTVIAGIAWGFLLAKGDEMARDIKGRTGISDMSKMMRNQNPIRVWYGRALTAAQVVFFYMLGWTVLGAINLVLSLLVLYFWVGMTKQLKTIMLNKLSAE